MQGRKTKEQVKGPSKLGIKLGMDLAPSVLFADLNACANHGKAN